MIVVMDDFDKSLDTLEEVKKLQDLVRKLEIQNQQLRNKQNRGSRKSSSDDKDILKPCHISIHTTDENSASFTNCASNNNNDLQSMPLQTIEDPQNDGFDSLNYLDEIDLIRISDVDTSDDDSWLYTSPKGLTPEQKNESPYLWLRRDVDDPENKELQLAKKALITKLNELEILSPTSQVKKLQQKQTNQVIGGRKPFVPCKISPTRDIPQNTFDTRTFTKSQKKQALEYLSTKGLIETKTERHESQLCRRGSDASLDSLSGTYTMADANDVQEVARMQEESLRLSSPVGTPKRHYVNSNHSSRRLSVSSRSSVSDVENMEHTTPNSQTNNKDNNDLGSTTCTSITSDTFNYSDQSSPSVSPYGSDVSLNKVGNDPKGDMYRRSMPNLNRSIPGTKSKLTRGVPRSIDKKQPRGIALRSGASAGRSDSNLAASAKTVNQGISSMQQKLKQPTKSSFVTPPSNTSPYRYNQKKTITPPMTPRHSESTSRLPAKTGLPKPTRTASASKLWSGIPVNSVPNRKNSPDDSWSEGCF